VGAASVHSVWGLWGALGFNILVSPITAYIYIYIIGS
jgi:hypothetical protein